LLKMWIIDLFDVLLNVSASLDHSRMFYNKYFEKTPPSHSPHPKGRGRGGRARVGFCDHWLQSAPKEVLAKIPVELERALVRKCRSFKDDVLAYSRSQRTLARALSDLKVFQESDSRYPAKSRPFKSSVTFVELDDELSAVHDDAVTWSIVIPKAATRRTALSLLHRFVAVKMKEVDVEALQAKVNSKATSADVSCLNKIVDETVEAAQKEDAVQTLGLPKPVKLEIAKAVLENKVQEIYTKIYTEINMQMEKEVARDSPEPDDKDDLELQVNPHDLLKSAVKQVVQDELVEQQLMDSAARDVDMQPQAAAHAQQFIDYVSKNEQSPPAGAGQNRGSPKVWPPKKEGSAWPSNRWSTAPSPPQRQPRPGKGKGKGHLNQVQGARGRNSNWWQGIHSYAQNKAYLQRMGQTSTNGSGDKSGGQKGAPRGKH
jgi:hypothetical protein